MGLALVVALAERGNPLRELARSLAHQPATAAYLASVLLMTGWSVMRFGASGAAFFIDSLLAPGLVALLLARLDVAGQARLFTLVCGALVGNALLGIGEQLLQMRLIPYTVGDGIALVENVFRATGLFGHPLTSATITGFALFVLYRLRERAARFGLCLVALAALLSFGGRTALAVDVTLLAGLAAVDLGRHATREGLSYRELTGGAVLIVAMLTVLAVAVATGSIGQRIMTSLAWDESAQVRTRSTMILTLLELAPAAVRDEPGSRRRGAWEVGIRKPDTAIECFWLVLVLQVGVPLLAVFAACFIAFLARLARLGGVASALGLIGFLVVVSTSNSIAVKTELLAAVVALAQLAGAYRCTGLLQQAAAPARPLAGFPPRDPLAIGGAMGVSPPPLGQPA